MTVMDDVVELEVSYGNWLVDSCDYSDDVGDIEKYGWAGLYDVSSIANFGDYNCVIVALWPDQSVKVEAFISWAISGLRWLQWDEAFRVPGDLPKEGDMILEVTKAQFVEINTGLIFPKWDDVVRFTKKVGLKKKGGRVWFLDRSFGNYFLWDLP